MLQQEKPEDFVIATGIQYSVRDFIVESLKLYGIKIEWIGKGVDEKGKIISIEKNKFNELSRLKVGDIIIQIDKKYFRPADVDNLCGDATKAKRKLDWVPRISFEELVKEMTESDYSLAIKN